MRKKCSLTVFVVGSPLLTVQIDVKIVTEALEILHGVLEEDRMVGLMMNAWPKNRYSGRGGGGNGFCGFSQNLKTIFSDRMFL